MMGKLLPLRRVAGVAAEMSDEALIAACALGDSAALGGLFDRFHQPLFRFLSRYLGSDPADIDDLVQMTFLAARRSAAGFRGQSTVRAWIFGIAANVARHHIRGEMRRRNMLQGASECLPDKVRYPDEAAERQQLVARLQTALPGLSHDLRAAFVMCDLEGISTVEAARVLGVRDGTLRRRLHDARKALRAALEGRPG